MPLFAPGYESDRSEVSAYDSDDDVPRGGARAHKVPDMDFGGVRKLSEKERDALRASSRNANEEVESQPLRGVPAPSANLVRPWATYRMPEGSEGLCIDYSPDGGYVAVGCRDGCTRVLHARTGEHGYTVGGDFDGATDHAPHAAVRFRPETGAFSTRNVLLAGTTDGKLLHYHATSGKLLSAHTEPGAQFFCVEYRGEGTSFAAAGEDGAVRVYDEGKGQPACTAVLRDGDGVNSVGHSSRVYSLTWHPGDPNTLVSGGWDRTVQIWDLRVGQAVRSIYGPYVCGDAIEIDAEAGEVLAGSWRTDANLQVYDFGSGSLKTNIPFDVEGEAGTMLYTAKWGRGGLAGHVLAGGSGPSHAVRAIRRDTGGVACTVPTTAPVHHVAAKPGEPEQVAICTSDSVHLAALSASPY